MSAKSDVLRMINKRAKQFKEMRTNSSRNMTPQQVVFKFFEEMEKSKAASCDAMDMDVYLQQQTRLLLSRLQAFDKDVSVEIMWHNIDAVTDWKDMRLNGVKIMWAPTYQKENPGTDPEVYVDLNDLLFSFF